MLICLNYCFFFQQLLPSLLILVSGIFKNKIKICVQSGGGGGAGGASEAARLCVRAGKQLVHLPERQHEEPDPEPLRTPSQQRSRPTGVQTPV